MTQAYVDLETHASHMTSAASIASVTSFFLVNKLLAEER